MLQLKINVEQGKNTDMVELKVKAPVGSYIATTAIPEDVFNKNIAHELTEIQVTHGTGTYQLTCSTFLPNFYVTFKTSVNQCEIIVMATNITTKKTAFEGEMNCLVLMYSSNLLNCAAYLFNFRGTCMHIQMALTSYFE